MAVGDCVSCCPFGLRAAFSSCSPVLACGGCRGNALAAAAAAESNHNCTKKKTWYLALRSSFELVMAMTVTEMTSSWFVQMIELCIE